MPDGIERPELIRRYAVDTGLTVKKAEEHLELLEESQFLLWDDLRLYTTSEGMRWAGYKRDHTGDLVDSSERAEEKYRTRAHAQTASSDKAVVGSTPDPTTHEQAGNTSVTPGTRLNKNAQAHTRTRKEAVSRETRN